MLEANEEIKEGLKERTVEPGEDGKARCPHCGSDDLMRELPDVGVEWGYEWIMEYLVREEGEAIDLEEITPTCSMRFMNRSNSASSSIVHLKF
jgi:hypothetical protein